MIDPLLQLVIALPFVALFLSSSWHKRQDPARFQGQLNAYGLLPEETGKAVAFLLPWIELCVALALVVPALRGAAGFAAAVLLGLYGSAIMINLLRGNDRIDCGCGGPAQPLSYWLVARNALLACVAMLLLLPAGDRGLTAIDAF